MGIALPTGQRGQLLALGLSLICLAALWFGVAAPLVAWYGERAERLHERMIMARHMESLAANMPALEQQVRARSTPLLPANLLLQGPSDSVAGATLQGLVQDLAARAGATLSSAEILPGQPVGGFRRIGLQVSINATQWPDLVRLLQSIVQATPRMLLDDLQVRAAPALRQRQGAGGPSSEQAGSPNLDASFTIFAFRPDVAGIQAP